MKKKLSILVIIILAIFSTVWFFFRNNLGYGFMGSIMMDGDAKVMPYEDISYKNTPPLKDQFGMRPNYFNDHLEVGYRLYEDSASYSVVVDDVADYIRTLKNYFTSIDGVILDLYFNSGSNYDTASIYVKVPVDKFDQVDKRIVDDVKEVATKSIYTIDVTAQVTNISEQLDSLLEEKLLKEAQLKDAKTQAEKTRLKLEIDRLARQIKSYQKNKQNIENKVKYAGISVTVSNDIKYFNPEAHGDFKYELKKAYRSLKSFFAAVLVFTIWVAVYSVIWIPVVFIFKKLVAKLKK